MNLKIASKNNTLTFEFEFFSQKRFELITVFLFPPVAELTAYFFLARVVPRVVKFGPFDRIRQKLRRDEIALKAMGILIVLAIVELLHQFGGSIAEMKRHREIARGPDLRLCSADSCGS